jgi:hypothetical protein
MRAVACSPVRRRKRFCSIGCLEWTKRQVPDIETVNVPGTHSDFVFTSREQVMTAMRRFLTESVPES